MPSPFPIDFVWTFCSSKANAEQRAHRAPKDSIVIKCPNVPDLKYSLRSALKNAPYYRKIFIVMADGDSLPSYINPRKVKVIKHSQIIPKEFLPTFNSNVIDSYIHKIPGLAEHFVFFNDDTYIGRPTPWSQFFTLRGKPINRHYPGPTRHRTDVKTNNMFVRMMQHAIKAYGMDNTHYQHQAQPFTKTLLSHYENRFKREMYEASSNKYRQPNDFNLIRFTTCFSSTEKLASVRYTPETNDYFTESNDPERIEYLRMNLKRLPRFICINNTGPNMQHIVEFLDSAFPEPSKVEF